MKIQIRSPWPVIIIVILMLSFFSMIVVGFVTFVLIGEGEDIESGNVAVIPIQGVIMIDKSEQIFSADAIASSSSIAEQIEKAENDPFIQAIIFNINSPGGAPVASAEITRAIKECNKTTVAVIREYGTSGAYWAASGTNYIIANEVSITGSIGVIGSYLQYEGLMERYNVSYERFVAGEYKDMGSPYREMSGSEKQIYQSELNIMHDIFANAVAENRNLELEYVESLATGQIFLGVEAVELGLVDELGGMQEAYAYIENILGISVYPIKYEEEKSVIEMLMSALDNTGFNLGLGIGSAIVNNDNKKISLIQE